MYTGAVYYHNNPGIHNYIAIMVGGVKNALSFGDITTEKSCMNETETYKALGLQIIGCAFLTD